MSKHVVDYFATGTTFMQPSSSALQAAEAGTVAAAAADAVDAALLPHIRQTLGSTAGGSCSMLTVLGPAAAAQGSATTAGSHHNSSTAALCPGSSSACALPSTDALRIEQAVQQLGCESTVVTSSNLSQQQQQQPWHLVRFACSGCEPRLLQVLLARPWDAPSVLEHTGLLLIDMTLAQPASSSSNSDGRCGVDDSALHRSAAAATEGSACQTSSSNASSTTGWDDVFNLLHQQLGFRGFWRQQLDGRTLRLGWVRQGAPAHARLQEPDSSHAAGVLRAAAAKTARADLVGGACDCCSTCCGSASIGSGRCRLWHRARCMLLGSVSSRQCITLVAAESTASTSNNSSRAADRHASSGGAAFCQACCHCKLSVWGVLHSKVHAATHASSNSSSASSSGASSWAGLSVGMLIPVLLTGAVGVASGLLFTALRFDARAQRVASLQQAKLDG